MPTPTRQISSSAFASPTVASGRSQYPFPQSPQRDLLQRESTVSSIHSLNETVAERNATIETNPNAISTLLQHPIIRTGLQNRQVVANSGYKAPTQRDIPPVTLTNIPQVDAKTFQSYLTQVGSLYEAFQRAKNEDDGDKSLFQRDRKNSPGEDWEEELSQNLQRPTHSRTNSTASTITSPLEGPQAKRSTSIQRRHTVTPLSTIPSVYFEEDFHLENPRTFDIVSERSELIRDPNAPPSARKSLATNAILQEKLSWYMDTVEVYLISSISTASKSFFSALGSLRGLHAEAEDSINRIQKLRKDLSRLDKEMAIDGLKVVNLKQRRNNVRQLAEAMMQLEDIVASVHHCEEMVEQGQIDGALNVLDEVEILMSGKEPKSDIEGQSRRSRRYTLRDLRHLKALEGALEDLNQLRFRIGRGFESRFHQTLLSDIRKHVENVHPTSTLQRWGNAFVRLKTGPRRPVSGYPAYMSFGPEFRGELEAELKGLARARHTIPAATAFRALILREMKNIIRKQLPSSNDDDNMSTMSASTHRGGSFSQREKSSTLSRNLQALDPEDWFSMLCGIYTRISEGLRRLSMQAKILLDITVNLDQTQIVKPIPPTPDPSSTLSPGKAGRPRSVSQSIQVDIATSLDLSSLLGEAVDSVQAHILKVVRVRSAQNVEMPLPDFLRYFTLIRLFTDECEAISGQGGTALKQVVDNQIKEFVAQFGNKQRSDLIAQMDNDRWEARDFGEEENRLLERVVEGSTQDSVSWTETCMIWQPSENTTKRNGRLSNGTTTASERDATPIPSTKVRTATLDSQAYILPISASAMLTSLESYQHLTVGIPNMASEIGLSLIETLKLFNSRTAQLILGAGATRSAGLRNITTKHLALSSQALSFAIALIPHIREFFRRYLPAGSVGSGTGAALSGGAQPQVMAEFDKIKRLLQEHQAGIHEKLIDIMSSRAAMHVRTMKSIDFDALAAAAGGNTSDVSPYIETLCKETATLQKVLAKFLPEGMVLGIMVPVFRAYRETWDRAFQEVVVRTAAGKSRLLSDAQFFQSRISRLEGSADTGDAILAVVRNKQLALQIAQALGSNSGTSEVEEKK